ncbi:MAG: MFS transporter [Betaproteobacteria bacterium]|nr:MFS transporter [Betaproteobacteria bacterium]
MLVPGALNDLARGLAVPVPAAGWLITVAAWTMALTAPLLAALLSRFDRRRLLAGALAWYAVGHALSAAMPQLAALLPVRAATVVAAAVFTPAAAAVAGALAPPERRGEAIAFIFLGWSLASVLGMPMASYVSGHFGWPAAFVYVAALSAVAALAAWRHTPAGLRLPVSSLRALVGVLTRRDLMAVVVVTALSACGQFTLFSYMAPYYDHVLGADAAETSALFLWFGVFGVVGSVLMARWIDRLGAGVAATLGLAAMALSLLAWPLAGGIVGIALVLVPWALGCFSSNSAQQARLALAAPAHAAVLVSLNSSAIYLGQGIGAATGGLLLAGAGYGSLAPAAAAGLLTATLLSAWLVRGSRAPAAAPKR